MVKHIQCTVVISTCSFLCTLFHTAAQAEIDHSKESKGSVAESETTTVEAGPKESEVETVSANGSITRAKCPHTCADRNIPKSSCKEWRSKMYPDVCYVEDLSIPSNAIPLGKLEK